MSNVLITGGAGFIGSHLTERLLQQGHQITVIDDLSSGDRRNVEHLLSNPRYEFIGERVTACPGLPDLVRRADLIHHLAATVGVFNIIDNPAATIENNIETTTVLLEHAAQHKTKVILASTSEVYGKSPDESFHEEGDLVLGPTSKCRWSYAASKIVDEFLALAFCRQYDLPVVIARMFNTVGPRQIGNYGMVVPRFIEQALRNEALTVYGDGRQARSFTYVDDVVHWLDLLANDEGAVGQVFNLGNPEETTVADLARHVIELTGSSSQIEFIPYEKAYEDGFDDMRRRLPNIDKVVALTGYRPRVDLKENLRRTIDWFIEERAAARGDASVQSSA
jgi:UDP-glucose 4-epimerase